MSVPFTLSKHAKVGEIRRIYVMPKFKITEQFEYFHGGTLVQGLEGEGSTLKPTGAYKRTGV